MDLSQLVWEVNDRTGMKPRFLGTWNNALHVVSVMGCDDCSDGERNVTLGTWHICSEVPELKSQSVKYDALSLLLLPIT